MKKLLLSLLAIVMILPIAVKADLVYYSLDYNQKPTVGGYFELHIPVPSNVTTFKINYDSTMIKPVDDIYSINDHLEGENGEINDKFVKNVTIENGSILIEVDHSFWDKVHDEYGDSLKKVYVMFTSLKEGESLVSVDYMNDGTRALGARFTATALKTDDNIGQKEEPKEETKEESKEEVKDDTKEEKKCDNLFLYISLGLNALLFIILLVVLLKKKNKKELVVNQEEAK